MTARARKLVRPAFAQTLEAHHAQRSIDSLLPFRAGDVLDAQAVADVLAHAHVREQSVVLEDGVGVPHVRRYRGDIAAAQLDAPSVGALEARDHPEQRGLSGTRWAEEREELPILDDQVRDRDRDNAAVVLTDALKPEGRGFWFVAQSRDAMTCLICVYSSSE